MQVICIICICKGKVSFELTLRQTGKLEISCEERVAVIAELS